MKPREMSNEQLAAWLDSLPSDDGVILHTVCHEAAARLRTPTIRSDNSAVIAELERRLKVAEDAIQDAIDEYCLKCNVSADDRREVCDQCHVCDWKEALAEICGEGGAE